MADISKDDTKVSRRDVFGLGSAALAAASWAVATQEADAAPQQTPNHTAPNESNPGPPEQGTGRAESGLRMVAAHGQRHGKAVQVFFRPGPQARGRAAAGRGR